jgi:hypothetical protein
MPFGVFARALAGLFAADLGRLDMCVFVARKKQQKMLFFCRKKL